MNHYKYDRVGREEPGEENIEEASELAPTSKKRSYIAIMTLTVAASLTLVWIALGGASASPTSKCDSVWDGYNCDSKISHFWGQYSPYYRVPSKISSDFAKQCKITFANVLSRHGARDPTASKTAVYSDLVSRITSDVQSFTGKYAFLADYEYTLGADQLTTFGQQEMINSGAKFYERYKTLASKAIPFVRSAGENRVVESAMNFTQGYHEALVKDKSSNKDNYPYSILVIPEETGINNTLNHGLCTAYEDGPSADLGDEAQTNWTKVFVPPIQMRLNNDLPGANLSTKEIVYFMDLCPFNTVASPTGAISPFCSLFTESEWHAYDYYQSLGKYYGPGPGNPLGPTQGVGFTNELIARLTNSPVIDYTSTNTTLDENANTFPIDKAHTLFADFSHDNDMLGILGALGVYNNTKPLSTTKIETTTDTNGYSASWAVPFAARIYFEKFVCEGRAEEMVRIVVNDRVLPLSGCGSDGEGMCVLSKFVESLSFARAGGYWDQCFVE